MCVMFHCQEDLKRRMVERMDGPERLPAGSPALAKERKRIERVWRIEGERKRAVSIFYRRSLERGPKLYVQLELAIGWDG